MPAFQDYTQDVAASRFDLVKNTNTTIKRIKVVVRGQASKYDFNRVQCFLGEQARLCRWLSRALPAVHEISFCRDITWHIDPDKQDWKPDIAWSDRVRRALLEVKDKLPVGKHATSTHILYQIFPGQLHGDGMDLRRAYEYEGVTSAHSEPLASDGEGGNVISHAELQRALQWAL